jgi:hypothetical protein
MKTYILALTMLVAVATGAREAQAGKKHHRYVGIHPIAKVHGGGMCHIQAPHVHAYAPIDKVQFREHDGYAHFVGDPVAYDWDGPRHTYYGHHPVPVHVIVGDDHPDVEYCYIEGPHFHAWAPPPEMNVKLEAGAYWYIGDFPEPYVAGRVTYDPIDVVYEPIRYERPAVVVETAPPGWYGVVVAAPVVEVRGRGHKHGRSHVHGDAVVGAGVEVRVPAPAVRVEVAVPSVQIGIGGGVVVPDHGQGPQHKHKKFKRRGRR